MVGIKVILFEDEKGRLEYYLPTLPTTSLIMLHLVANSTIYNCRYCSSSTLDLMSYNFSLSTFFFLISKPVSGMKELRASALSPSLFLFIFLYFFPLCLCVFCSYFLFFYFFGRIRKNAISRPSVKILLPCTSLEYCPVANLQADKNGTV